MAATSLYKMLSKGAPSVGTTSSWGTGINDDGTCNSSRYRCHQLFAVWRSRPGGLHRLGVILHALCLCGCCDGDFTRELFGHDKQEDGKDCQVEREQAEAGMCGNETEKRRHEGRTGIGCGHLDTDDGL